ncbi:uncharacterized protein [Branchiostoma lanceolatum]|uniref:uncharacterized protein isoform X2 n=1 Tax=Branchiostoma lanceolatum TaxID=7740 RepID=UPI003452A8AF
MQEIGDHDSTSEEPAANNNNDWYETDHEADNYEGEYQDTVISEMTPAGALGDVHQEGAQDLKESQPAGTSKLRDILNLPVSYDKASGKALKNIQGSKYETAGRSTDDSNETKKAVPAFLAAAAKEIGGKVVSKLGDRIAEGVVENHQEKVVNGLQNYLGKQMDTFDDEYKELLKDTSGLAAGLNRPVEEADIQLVPRPGATMGNMYAPPGWEIRHKYKYKDDRDKDKSSSGGKKAYTYPNGLGPVLMNGCFGTGYKNGDPCWEAKIPLEGCPNMIDGATYLGVGFDGRGVYSAESRKKSVIQRSCKNLQTYGKNEVPDSMTMQGIYDTNVESFTFSSMEEYRQYLAEKSAVTSAKAMFQEEINKASGHGAGGGMFGLVFSVGGGKSSQKGSSSQSSSFSASSSASAQLSEKQTRTFMAMLEMNIFRYEIFMDDVTPDRLNVGFLRDFISLPESYFLPGAEIIFQNFYLRWGTHYIKSAQFGGQLKIIKTKQATKDLTMSEFATRAEADWKMTMSTFSAQASQTKSRSWWHEHETKKESKQSSGQAASGSESQANRKQEQQASSQEYSSEMLVVQGGDQQIAAAITEMYTTALTTELKDWLESIDDYPKPFSFVLRPVSDLLDIPFVSLFPAGEVDYGCFGKKDLKLEEGTGRKYYTAQTEKPVDGNKGSTDGNKTITVSEIRYCNFADRKTLEDSMAKKRLSLSRAVTVYLEEGRLLSSDFLLPAGEAGCETAMLALLQGDNTGVPAWEDMTGGKEFTVVFDMPYNIPGILQAQDVMELKFFRHKWFSNRRGFVPHLYDGYKNGGSNDIQEKKVSVQGLVMTYDEETGVFTVTDDDFEASAPLIQDLPVWIKGRDVARAEHKKLLNHLRQKSETVGNVPCSIKWSNAHRFDPTDGGKCIHFTAASEGDIFVVFASIPRNHETWIYIQISPDGVALYKAMRLKTTQLNDNAGGLGSATLYQSYFVCVTEDIKEATTLIQYGKTPDNEERPHVWLSFTFHELASIRYYSFGSGDSSVKVMGLSLLDRPAKDFIVCRQGTEIINGVCQQKCHAECKGCRTSGSNSPTDCIACEHLKVSYPYREAGTGAFECVAQCPQHMHPVPATKTCTCVKRLEKARPSGVVDCKTECPLTHFDDNNVCKECSSFCTDVSDSGKRICSGPDSKDCDTCKYQHEGRCVDGCSPGQNAVREDGSFTCRKCQAGHECKLGDERENICPAGKYSNKERTRCEPCPSGEFSSTPGATSCQKCPAGQSSAPGSSNCESVLLAQDSSWVVDSTGPPSENNGVKNDAVKALDGNTGTYWDPVTVKNFNNWYISFDFKTLYTLNRIVVNNYGDTSHDIAAFKLQKIGSSYSWEDVVSVTNVQGGTDQRQEFGDFQATARYWRFVVTQTHSGWQPWLRELNFAGISSGVLLTQDPSWVVGSTGTSSDNNGVNNAAAKAFDGDLATYWNPQDTKQNHNNWYISLDFKVPYTLNRIAVNNYGDTSHDIAAFKLQMVGSSYSWEDVVSVTNVQGGTDQRQEFGDFQATARYWRFVVTQTHSGWQPWLRELNFAGISSD